MEYRCEHCKRQFEFEDHIGFCPFCGNRLDTRPDFLRDSSENHSIVRTIDTIWGETANLKARFARTIRQCVFCVNKFVDNETEKALLKQEFTKYGTFYEAIQKSPNRKTLLSRLDDYLVFLRQIIDGLDDLAPRFFSEEQERIARDAERMAKELYGFLGVRDIPFADRFLSEQNNISEKFCTKEELWLLFNLVLSAYEKYKKCVENNDMFVAFSSTSDFGKIPTFLRRGFFAFSTEDDEDESNESSDEEEIQFVDVVEYMKESLAQEYSGKLDEDCLPHVDAFWRGLQMLCVFIDQRFVPGRNEDRLFITDDESEKLERSVLSNQFYVSEARLEDAIEMEKRFENGLIA